MTGLLSQAVIGRHDELAVLRRGLESAADGRGETIVVAGEPGVGKTRLLREVRRWCSLRGGTALIGRGVQTTTPVAFRPLVEALLAADRAGARWDDPDVAPFLGVLAQLVPSLPVGGAIPAGPSMPSLLHVAEGLLRVLRTCSRGGPGVLLLDDMHWADPETRGVLEYLADHVPEEPVLVVVGSRPDRSLDAVVTLMSLVDRRSARLLQLSRLTADQVLEMTRHCLGDSAVPPAVQQLVQERADGLPFFVEELLAGLANDGVLVPADGAWHVRGDLRHGVPDTVAESVRRRCASLSQRDRQLLLDAALLGRQIDTALLAEVLDVEVTEIHGALRPAADLGLVEFGPVGARFRHALTRDALLAGMPGPERGLRARQVWASLRAARPTPSDELAEVTAELAVTAGHFQAAAELLLRVGRGALQQGALSSAEAALRRALALAEGTPLELPLMRELVMTLAAAGRADEIFPIGEELLARLDGQGSDPDGTERGEVHLALARSAVAATEWALATAHLDRVVGGEAHAVSAQVDTLRALVAIGEYRLDDATALAAAAVEASSAVEDADLHCEALLVHGRCLRARDLEAAGRIFERAKDVAHEAGLAHREARALAEWGFVEAYRRGGEAQLEVARRLAASCGAPETEAFAELALGAVAWWREAPETGLAHTATAERLGRRYRLGQLVPAALVTGAALHALRGDRAAMDAALAKALPLAGGQTTEMVALHAHCLAACALAEGDLATAAAELTAAVEMLHPARPAVIPPLVALDPLVRSVRGADAGEFGADLRTYNFHRDGQVTALLDAADAVLLGRAGEAEAATATIEAVRQKLGSNGFLHAVVSWLVASAAAEDGWGRPVVWLTDALESFETRGLRGAADACRTALRHLGRRVPRGADEFSPREQEVLALVSEGLPNREIGQRLFLSSRTVEKHVERLLAKTGTANRAQLATYALRQARGAGIAAGPSSLP
ncbi:AAA family ATPase [Pseudonocardia lutea]|uniref:AAA family ATPase n=1 Tax=Pseudonocardia lutea TaxID=2172015 RepID=A0ABW1ICI0_9PSEU